MSGAKKIARALNSWARDGLDFLGGADGSALEELISEFMADPGSEAHPLDCKSHILYEYSLKIKNVIVIVVEDFDSHFEGLEDADDSCSEEEEIPPLFEVEDDLYDPYTPSQDPSDEPQPGPSDEPQSGPSDEPQRGPSGPSDEVPLMSHSQVHLTSQSPPVKPHPSSGMSFSLPTPSQLLAGGKTSSLSRKRRGPANHHHPEAGGPPWMSGWTSSWARVAAVLVSVTGSSVGSTTAPAATKRLHSQGMSWTW